MATMAVPKKKATHSTHSLHECRRGETPSSSRRPAEAFEALDVCVADSHASRRERIAMAEVRLACDVALNVGALADSTASPG